jgi:putative DNA primase/helicase
MLRDARLRLAHYRPVLGNRPQGRITADNPHDRRELVAQARTVRLEDEIGRRGIKLTRCGAELYGPCPKCGGTDRFSISVAKQVWNCRGCQRGGDVIALVQNIDGLDFLAACTVLAGGEPAERQARSNGEGGEYERRQHEKAAWLWSQRRPIAGTPAERYLREVRRITCPLPATLAFLPALKPEHHPAMIAAFSLVDEPEPGELGAPRNVDSVHLTLLKPDGSGKAGAKPNKLTIGGPLGRPLVLAPPDDLLRLAITEGIEDALTARQATGLGAWAAGSAGFMPALADAVPNYIEAVTVFAHPDKSGRNSALELADALDRRGIEVFIEGL